LQNAMSVWGGKDRSTLEIKGANATQSSKYNAQKFETRPKHNGSQ